MSNDALSFREQYIQSIPSCCDLGPQEHEDMMLCWGLSYRVENDKSLNGLCDDCDLNNHVVDLVRMV